MDNYGTNGTDAPHMHGRHTQPQPPHPPEMTHNPQGQLPHMFGNFSNQPSNGYPQIHMPATGMPMQQQMGQQANPNVPGMQRPYPPAPYPNPQGPPPVSAPLGGFPPGRPREWETPDQRAAIERESKRARPYSTGPNDPSYTNQQGAFNRNPPMGMPPQHHGQGPAGLAPPGQQMPRMPPTTAPAIHPPSHPFPGRNSFTSPMNMPPRGPPGQQGDDYQYPPKPPGPYANHPPDQQGSSYDSLPVPPRKDFQSISDRSQGPRSDIRSSEDRSETTESEENPISFKDFLLRQPDTISPQDAKEKYDLYVREFTRKKPNKFFNIHRNEEWFKERYDPDYVLARAERIKEEVKARAGDFRELWGKGGSAVCAPDISSASLDRKQEKHIQKKESPTRDENWKEMSEGPRPEDVQPPHKEQPGEIETKSLAKDEGENQILETKPEEAKQEVAPLKVESAKKTSDLKKEDKPEPISSVKTENMEDGANTEVPAGREDGVAGDRLKEEVQLAVGTEQRVEVKGDDKGTEGEERGDKDQKGLTSAEAYQEDTESSCKSVLPLRREHQKHTIFMRGIPVNLKRKDLTEVLKHGPTGKMNLQLRRLKIGDINPVRGLERFAWAVYASEEAAAIAIEKVRGFVVRSKPSKRSGVHPSDEKRGSGDVEDASCVYEIDCMINLQRKKRYTQGRVLPSTFGTPERMQHDVTQSVKMMRYLDKLREVGEELNPLTDEFLEKLPSDGIRLDHVVTYLREVHYFCYYSGNEFLEDSTSMPPQELRPSGERLSRTMSENDSRVVKRVDDRARWVLERDYDRPRSNSDSAEIAKKNAVQMWLDSNTKNEGQGRYRCGLPPHKLFKGPEFVHKHLRTKHADRMDAVMAKAYDDVYRANFENDPSKDEVISIYNDGLQSAQQKASGGRPTGNQQGRQAQQFGFPQTRPNALMGMYNPTGSFMGMGMQPFPMMMVPPTGGYPAAYTAAGGYPNAMALAGHGMGGMAGQRMNASGMVQMGMQGADNGAMPGRGGRNRDGSRDFRDSGYRGGGYRDGGHRGGRRGGYVRRGGDQFRRGHGDGRPLDPRASGPRRTYNDLDAPANGPSFDLVQYDDV